VPTLASLAGDTKLVPVRKQQIRQAEAEQLDEREPQRLQVLAFILKRRSLWADELCLSTFRVVQYAGPQFRADEDRDDECLLEEALMELMEEARSQIHVALREEFGNDSLLFVSLWNTLEYRRDEDIPEPESKLLAGDEGPTSTQRKTEKSIGWRMPTGYSTPKLQVKNWRLMKGLQRVCTTYIDERVACHRGRSRKTLPDSWNSFGASEEETDYLFAL